MEVVSQLTLMGGDEILKRIHSLLNLMNRERAEILPWMDFAIAKVGFGTKIEDDTTERLGRALNTCLQTENVDQLRAEAGKLKDLLDRTKDRLTEDFRRILEPYRKQPLSDDGLRAAFINGLARRVGVRPDVRPLNEVVAAMSAYFEFEKDKLKEAARNREYKPENHRNDVLDVEQLVYLDDAGLHFLTCDKAYLRRTQKSPQRARIHAVPPHVLKSAPDVEDLIERITT
jgi:hypothetical protein